MGLYVPLCKSTLSGYDEPETLSYQWTLFGPDPAASLNCDARTGQRIEAKCSQPVARLSLNNMTVI